jgi:exopolysaccharide production protein ExoY
VRYGIIVPIVCPDTRHCVIRCTGPRVRWQFRIKRVIDVAGAMILISFTWPLILLSAIAIGLTSCGGVMFAQKRWGLSERHFRCYKLRSMYVSQPSADAPQTSGPGVLHKPKNDARITPVGSFLRRTSIDELPQLFNVLLGDMSLVGPRPLVLQMMDSFPEIRRWRCAMRPGITGLWQVRNRLNNTSVLDMVEDDLEYIENFSVILDLKILVATIPAVVRGNGAY